MRRMSKAAIVLITTVAMGHAGFAAGQAKPSEAIPPNEGARVVGQGLVRVVCEPESANAILKVLEARLWREALKDAVKARLLKATPATVGKPLPHWSLGPDGFSLDSGKRESVISGYLEIRSATELKGPIVGELLHAIAKELEAEIREADDGRKSLIETRDILYREVSVAQDLLQLNREKLQKIKQQLRLVSEEAAQATQQRARADLENGQLQIHGLRARETALNEQIAALAKKVDANATRDPVVVELMKVVDAREKLLATVRALHQNAAPGGGEDALANAEGSVAEARAELAKYQRAAAQSAGGDRLAELNKRLGDTQIDLAEAEARRDLLERNVEEVRAAQSDSTQVKQVESDIQIDEAQYRKLAERLRDADLELKLYRSATVTIIPQS